MHKIQRHVIKLFKKKYSHNLCRAGTDSTVCVCSRTENHSICQIQLLYVSVNSLTLGPGIYCARYYANKKQTDSQPKILLVNSNN